MPPTAPSANDLLMGSGIPSAKFSVPGDLVTGKICAEPTVTQQSDFSTQKPIFYDDDPEKPAWQVVVTLQTTLRDPAIENDDGKRKLYLKNQMKQAVSEGVKAAGATALQVGGDLTVRFTHEIPGKGNPAKQYDSLYVPPPSAASTELGLAPLGTTGAVGAAAPVATQAALAPLAATATPSVAAAALAAQQAAATVAPTGVTPDPAAALAAMLAASPELAAAYAAAAAGVGATPL